MKQKVTFISIFYASSEIFGFSYILHQWDKIKITDKAPLQARTKHFLIRYLLSIFFHNQERLSIAKMQNTNTHHKGIFAILFCNFRGKGFS